MSWQEYVDKNLVGSGDFDKGAIYSVQGDSVWAQSNGFTLERSEVDAILTLLSGVESPQLAHIRQNGVYILKEKYTYLLSDDRLVHAKRDKEGVWIFKTKQAILIGHYPNGIIPGNASKTIGSLADYLINAGY